MTVAEDSCHIHFHSRRQLFELLCGSQACDWPVRGSGCDGISAVQVAVLKRPHLQTFLERAAQIFEVVIFTASQKVGHFCTSGVLSLPPHCCICTCVLWSGRAVMRQVYILCLYFPGSECVARKSTGLQSSEMFLRRVCTTVDLYRASF